MVSTYTPNKRLELPGYNDYPNDWNTPVNADFTALDTVLGGSTLLNVTSVSGDVTLSSTQYRPQQIIISGTLTANVRYLIPTSVGGQWTITNSASGAFTVKIASVAGGSDLTLPSGTTIVSCDGSSSGMRLSISSTAASSVSSFSAGATGLTPSTGTTGAVTLAGTLKTSNGGTGLTSTPTSGQLLIGNGTGYTLATITAGSGIIVTNSAGAISIAANTGGVGTVTSVNAAGGSTGLSFTGGPVTTSGTLTLSGTLLPASGGTGLTSYTTGDLLYASSASTMAKLTAVATGNVLLSSGAGVAPAWGKLDLTTSVTGALPLANGGTGGTDQATALASLGAAGLGANTYTGTQTAPTLAATTAVTGPRLNLSANNAGMKTVGAYTTINFNATSEFYYDGSSQYDVSIQGNVRMTIQNSQVQAVAFNPFSDRTLKKDITPLTGGLERVLAYQPVTFRWIDEAISGDRQNAGFIAQDMAAVNALAVTTNKDGIMGFNPVAVIADLVSAVQALSARVAALEAA